MNIEYLGIFATIILIISGIPQVIKCYLDGHADGISAGMLWLWFWGMFFMGIYVSLTRGGDWVLFTNYGLNICMIIIILKYKYFPTKPDNLGLYKEITNFAIYRRINKMFNS